MSASASASAVVGDLPVQGRRTSNPFRLLRSAEPWISAGFGISSFVIGLFWFCLLVPLIAAGLGTVITLFGLPLLALSFILWKWGARAERWRIGAFYKAEIPAPYRPKTEGSVWQRAKATLRDPATWKDLLYIFLLFPIGVAELVITTVCISVPFWLFFMPAFYSIGDGPMLGPDWRIDTLAEALAVAPFGLAAAIPAVLILVWMGRGHVALGRVLLGPSGASKAELVKRVDVLTKTRSGAMDAMLIERRRIERDLHDGAQQRLVALAMDLGMAKEKMATDPEAARALVETSHEEAKRVLVELRDLVRGIHPAVLTDRGLDAAISAVAGRSPVPVSVDVELAERPPEAIESTAYFVVVEALTNIAKHSNAANASVKVRRTKHLLIVEVADDGVGGANPLGGTGLTGLADRLAALDGRLVVESPAKGGTRVVAEIPCES